MNKICGIYKISNRITNKIYVGQSKDIIKRWRDHKTRLRSGNHVNIHLQNSWNKYGEGAFEFSVVEVCKKNFDVLNEREVYWINKLDALNDSKGYNIASGGNNSYAMYGKSKEELTKIYKKIAEARLKTWRIKGNPRKGSKLSEVQKKKISESLKGEKNFNFGKKRPEHSKAMKGINNPRARKVKCITTGEVFECIKFASEKYKINDKGIINCCRGNQKSAGKLEDGTKLIWEYI